MRRHENLRLAAVAFSAALAFIIFGSVVAHLLSPFLDGADIGYMLFKMLPLSFIAIGAVFGIYRIYCVINDRLIEKGKVINAEITGINEFFVGQATKIVHYNLFCEAVINGRKYRFSKKDIEENPRINLRTAMFR